VLGGADNPYQMLTWLRRSPAARLLGQLAGHPDDLTHESLDALPQGESTAYVRGLLVSAGILAARDENFALLTRWLARTLTKLPPAHVTLIRAFAEWHVLRDARRRSARGRYTYAAYRGDSVNIRAAARVLAWLDEQHLTLITLRQTHLDTWAAGNPTLRAGSIPFIRWAVARGLTTALSIAHPPTRPPGNFQVDDIQQEELRQCLTDRSLPRDVRIAGALTRLYALALTRVVELTAGDLHRDADNAYLTISGRPVVLPPSLAQLLEEQIAATTPKHLLGDANGYLLPGRRPGRARKSRGAGRHHAPARSSRPRRPQHRHDAVTSRPATDRDRRPIRDRSWNRPPVGLVRRQQLVGLPRRPAGHRIRHPAKLTANRQRCPASASGPTASAGSRRASARPVVTSAGSRPRRMRTRRSRCRMRPNGPSSAVSTSTSATTVGSTGMNAGGCRSAKFPVHAAGSGHGHGWPAPGPRNAKPRRARATSWRPSAFTRWVCPSGTVGYQKYPNASPTIGA